MESNSISSNRPCNSPMTVNYLDEDVCEELEEVMQELNRYEMENSENACLESTESSMSVNVEDESTNTVEEAESKALSEECYVLLPKKVRMKLVPHGSQRSDHSEISAVIPAGTSQAVAIFSDFPADGIVEQRLGNISTEESEEEMWDMTKKKKSGKNCKLLGLKIMKEKLQQERKMLLEQKHYIKLQQKHVVHTSRSSPNRLSKLLEESTLLKRQVRIRLQLVKKKIKQIDKKISRKQSCKSASKTLSKKSSHKMLALPAKEQLSDYSKLQNGSDHDVMRKHLSPEQNKNSSLPREQQTTQLQEISNGKTSTKETFETAASLGKAMVNESYQVVSPLPVKETCNKPLILENQSEGYDQRGMHRTCKTGASREEYTCGATALDDHSAADKVVSRNGAESKVIYKCKNKEAKQRSKMILHQKCSGSDSDEETVSQTASSGNIYWCKFCNAFMKTVRAYVDHILSADHQQNEKYVESCSWLRRQNQNGEKQPEDIPESRAIYGVESLRVTQVFYCDLCEYLIWDKESAILHPFCDYHTQKYKEHVYEDFMEEFSYMHEKLNAYAEYRKSKNSRSTSSDASLKRSRESTDSIVDAVVNVSETCVGTEVLENSKKEKDSCQTGAEKGVPKERDFSEVDKSGITKRRAQREPNSDACSTQEEVKGINNSNNSVHDSVDRVLQCDISDESREQQNIPLHPDSCGQVLDENRNLSTKSQTLGVNSEKQSKHTTHQDSMIKLSKNEQALSTDSGNELLASKAKESKVVRVDTTKPIASEVKKSCGNDDVMKDTSEDCIERTLEVMFGSPVKKDEGKSVTNERKNMAISRQSSPRKRHCRKDEDKPTKSRKSRKHKAKKSHRRGNDLEYSGTTENVTSGGSTTKLSQNKMNSVGRTADEGTENIQLCPVIASKDNECHVAVSKTSVSSASTATRSDKEKVVNLSSSSSVLINNRLPPKTCNRKEISPIKAPDSTSFYTPKTIKVIREFIEDRFDKFLHKRPCTENRTEECDKPNSTNGIKDSLITDAPIRIAEGGADTSMCSPVLKEQNSHNYDAGTSHTNPVTVKGEANPNWSSPSGKENNVLATKTNRHPATVNTTDNLHKNTCEVSVSNEKENMLVVSALDNSTRRNHSLKRKSLNEDEEFSFDYPDIECDIDILDIAFSNPSSPVLDKDALPKDDKNNDSSVSNTSLASDRHHPLKMVDPRLARSTTALDNITKKKISVSDYIKRKCASTSDTAVMPSPQASAQTRPAVKTVWHSYGSSNASNILSETNFRQGLEKQNHLRTCVLERLSPHPYRSIPKLMSLPVEPPHGVVPTRRYGHYPLDAATYKSILGDGLLPPPVPIYVQNRVTLPADPHTVSGQRPNSSTGGAYIPWRAQGHDFQQERVLVHQEAETEEESTAVDGMDQRTQSCHGSGDENDRPVSPHPSSDISINDKKAAKIMRRKVWEKCRILCVGDCRIEFLANRKALKHAKTISVANLKISDAFTLISQELRERPYDGLFLMLGHGDLTQQSLDKVCTSHFCQSPFEYLTVKPEKLKPFLDMAGQLRKFLSLQYPDLFVLWGSLYSIDLFRYNSALNDNKVGHNCNTNIARYLQCSAEVLKILEHAYEQLNVDFMDFMQKSKGITSFDFKKAISRARKGIGSNIKMKMNPTTKFVTWDGLNICNFIGNCIAGEVKGEFLNHLLKVKSKVLLQR